MSSDFMELFGEWGTDTNGRPFPLTVEPYVRQGNAGPVYAAVVSRPGLPQIPKRRLVRNSQGNELLSSTVIYANAADRGLFIEDSRVTLHDGSTTTIIAVETGDHGGMFSPFLVVSVE